MQCQSLELLATISSLVKWLTSIVLHAVIICSSRDKVGGCRRYSVSEPIVFVYLELASLTDCGAASAIYHGYELSLHYNI